MFSVQHPYFLPRTWRRITRGRTATARHRASAFRPEVGPAFDNHPARADQLLYFSFALGACLDRRIGHALQRLKAMSAFLAFILIGRQRSLSRSKRASAPSAHHSILLIIHNLDTLSITAYSHVRRQSWSRREFVCSCQGASTEGNRNGRRYPRVCDGSTAFRCP